MIQIRGKIERKSKFWGQLRVKLKKFTAKDHFCKRSQTLGTQLIEIRGEIEEIWNFNSQLGVRLKKNLRPRTKIKKALKSRAEIEVRQGRNWTKLKVWSQSEVQLRGIRSRRTITYFAKMAPFWSWLFIFFSREVAWMASFPRCFMLHLSTKLGKTYMKMITWHLTPAYMPIWSVLAGWHHIGYDTTPKWPTRLTIFLQQIWQPMIATLSQRLGSFQVKSRAEICHQ